MFSNVTVEIYEQPKPHEMRFRYNSEGNTAGSILGVNSTDLAKTYPSIRIHNYVGIITVCVSCVSVDKTPRPHPNRLIGTRTNKGVCSFDTFVTAESPIILFPQLGIQCPTKNDVVENLEERKKLNIDPFKTGYGHKDKPRLINLQQIRLCFQVFLKPNPTDDPKKLIPLSPVVSNIISDKNRTVKLHIYEKSDNSSPPCGDKKIMILCDRVDRSDIQVRFFEKGADGSIVWQAFGKFQSKNVHKQVGISLRTPPYKDQNITEPVNVFLNLQTITDGQVSAPVSFQYVPDKNNIELDMNTKTTKIDDSQALYELLQVLDAENFQDLNVANAENIPPDNFQFGQSNFIEPNSNVRPMQQSSQQNQGFVQHTPPATTFQAQKSDYQWPSASYEHSQCYNQQQQQQPQYYNQQQQHYQSMPQLPNYVGDSSRQGQMGPIYALDKVIIQQFCNNNVTVHQSQSVMDIPLNDF